MENIQIKAKEKRCLSNTYSLCTVFSQKKILHVCSLISEFSKGVVASK